MERQTLQLVRLLIESGQYNVGVAALGEEGVLQGELNALGFQHLPRYPLRSLHNLHTGRQLLRFAALLRESKTTILHTHDFYTNTFGTLAGVLAGVPVRITSRRELDVFSSWQRRIERLAYRASQCVVANSAYLRARLIQEGVPSDRCVILPNAVDLERIVRLSVQDHKARLESFGLPPGNQIVTMVGNLHNTRKDHLTFALAATQLARGFPNVVFVLAGAGELRRDLREVVIPLREKGRLILLGLCLRIPDLLAVSDICVLCSHSEGMPNVVLEYMAAGKPVVASGVGGLEEAVADGETGFLVRPRDPAAVAEHIAFLLRHPDLARSMGETGRERARRDFSLADQGMHLLDLYAGLLGKTGLTWRASGPA